jgi:hypothetical protein
MNILEEKIELAKRVLEENDLNLLEQIKFLFDNEEKQNVMDLPLHIKSGIYDSLKQAENQEFILLENVLKDAELLIKK